MARRALRPIYWEPDLPQTDSLPPTLPESADAKMFGPALTWWGAIVGATKRLPTRSELSPEDLTPVALPHVMLIDIAESGQKLRWRLMGTAHVEFNKRDLTGVDFDDQYPTPSPILAYVKGLYRDLIETRRPLWSVNAVEHFKTREALLIRRLMLPLSLSGTVVDLCASVQTIDFQQDSENEILNPWWHAQAVGEKERITL